MGNEGVKGTTEDPEWKQADKAAREREAAAKERVRKELGRAAVQPSIESKR